jgi:hypothetical protein
MASASSGIIEMRLVWWDVCAGNGDVSRSSDLGLGVAPVKRAAPPVVFCRI